MDKPEGKKLTKEELDEIQSGSKFRTVYKGQPIRQLLLSHITALEGELKGEKILWEDIENLQATIENMREIYNTTPLGGIAYALDSQGNRGYANEVRKFREALKQACTEGVKKKKLCPDCRGWGGEGCPDCHGTGEVGGV